jgi:hypothetical protein
MVQAMGELRGRVMLRPWRVGLLVDTKSAAEVRAAIADMSSVWGGYHMPIFDKNHSIEQLKQLGRLYDVDSLYAEAAEGDLGEFLRSGGWAWGYGGPWGPFRDDASYRKGLLLHRSLRSGHPSAITVTWAHDEELDLFHAATFGLSDGHDAEFSGFLADAHATLTIETLVGGAHDDVGRVVPIEATRTNVTVPGRQRLQSLAGIYVARVDHPEDIIEFWNWRTYGTPIVAVPNRGPEELIRYLTRSSTFGTEVRAGGGSPQSKQRLRVWGFADAEPATVAAIEATAERLGLTVWPQDRGNEPHIIFPGLETKFTRSIRSDFRPTTHSVDISLPELPLHDDVPSLGLGVVAADVAIHSVTDLDPRLTASLPPFRRHSALLEHVTRSDGADRVRVTTEGMALGIQADQDHLQVSFAYNLDSIRLLFDDPELSVSQSDQGKFQTRAAEVLGGAFSGLLNQPGVRAAILEASRKIGGVTLRQLRQAVKRNRGAWPDPLFGRSLDPLEYAKRQVNYLLHSGLFVPMLDIHCSHCRVDSQVNPKDLDAVLRCEFCGEEFRLALSLSLSRPEWRYRLASHLSADKVQALLPTIATTSLLGQMRLVEAPPLSHVLGMELKFKDSKAIEVDVAAYVPDRTWAAVVGEVKSGNRIDANDLANLKLIQQRLHDKQAPHRHAQRRAVVLRARSTPKPCRALATGSHGLRRGCTVRATRPCGR